MQWPLPPGRPAISHETAVPPCRGAAPHPTGGAYVTVRPAVPELRRPRAVDDDGTPEPRRLVLAPPPGGPLAPAHLAAGRQSPAPGHRPAACRQGWLALVSSNVSS